MLEMIAKLLKILNSEADPNQIGLAFGFSMIAGFTPILSLHNILILLLALILRINLSAFILGFLFFSGLAYLLDPFFNSLGILVLTAGLFEGLWTLFYNSTLWRLENFNNSIVMGSLLFSIIIFVPFVIIVNKLIIKYRENILEWVRKSRIMQALKASKLYNLYMAAQ